MNNRKGFTLIELLIVVVIIGILAAVAVPKFGATREKAYTAAVQSDLRNMGTSQELFYAEEGRYTANVDSLVLDAGFSRTADVTFGTITVGASNWAIAATSHDSGGDDCVAWGGTGTAPSSPANLPSNPGFNCY